MSDDFFNLKGKPSKIKEGEMSDFIDKLISKSEIRDIIYYPNKLEPIGKYPRIKVERKSFINVSFSKTLIRKVDFTNCHFEDCLFIGSKIDNCKFSQCTFKNVNTHDITITRTYINPQSFSENFDKKDIEKSNIAVRLYQQLLNNSRDEEQSYFARIANYNFKVWQGRLEKSKYKKKKPYPITKSEYYKAYIPNIIHKITFGYGLRIRNFVYTFLVTFSFFFLLNFIFWEKYKLHSKDFIISSFDSELYNFKANFFYTSDVMTKLVDSQFQPSSDFGMFMMVIQGFSGFVLFSFLITTLINRFIK